LDVNYYVYLGYIKVTLANQFDVVYRDIDTVRGKITLIFIEDLIDGTRISNYIIRPLQGIGDNLNNGEDIRRTILKSTETATITTPDSGITNILAGNVIILFEFIPEVLSCDVKKFSKRPVQDAKIDVAAQGPQEAFNEVLLDNICLLRRRIKNPNLKLERFIIGRSSQTTVVVIYMEGVTPPELVSYIRKKISAMDIDFILDVSYIGEQFKEGYTFFDTLSGSERPDTVASRLFEGRVAVLVDGTPFVLTAPTFFMEFFQAADDYYLNKYVVGFTRMIRVGSLFVSLMLPGLYVAIATNHLNLLPTTIAFTIAMSRATVPFPMIAEVLLMLMFFELTQKAGKRLPAQIGQSLSIVSALILGQSAINAGLTSDSTVVIMGIYAITSFINPQVSSASSMWSVFVIILSAISGMHGFFVGLIVMAAHLTSLKSCGYPYIFPIGTATTFSSTDFFLRSDLGSISSMLIKKGGKS